jgi:hypothetical protein
MNKEIKEQLINLKDEIKNLKKEIDVLKFKIKNPFGFGIERCFTLGYGPIYYLQFINNIDEIKEIKLDRLDNTSYKIIKDKNGNPIIEASANYLSYTINRQYKFDIDTEVLIQIKEEKNANE